MNGRVLFEEVIFEDDNSVAAELDADLLGRHLRSDAAVTVGVLKRGLNYSHDAMVDMIVANPGVTQNELAAAFGYTPSWISQVINSDVFQAKLAARASEFRDPILIASMEEQFKGVLARGLELMRNKLNTTEAGGVTDNFLLRSVELSSRALGYGAKKDDAPRSGDVSEKLADLSNNLVNLLRKQKAAPQVFEGELAQ